MRTSIQNRAGDEALPLLGRNDSVRFFGVRWQTEAAMRFGFFHPRKPHSPNGDSYRALPNDPPSPGGEGRGEGELSSNCIVRVEERVGVKANFTPAASFGLKVGYRTRPALEFGAWNFPQVSSFKFRVSPRAFSLIEILITVGLLSFIILGLLLMFNQVQRAFRSSMTQTDVLEAGRAVTDTMARGLEEMTPSQIRANPAAVNFMAELENKAVDNNFAFDDPLRQFLPGAAVLRTNYVQRFFFMSRVSQDYVGTGYLVVPQYSNSVSDVSVGTLYRYSVKTNKAWAASLASDFRNSRANSTNLHRVADGVVHLRVRAFDTRGALITPNTQGTHNVTAQWESTFLSSPYVTDQIRYYFYSNAVPAYVELEIGFLEPHLLDRYKALEESDFFAGLTAVPHARNYLSNQVANVHLFRRRIPIHNVDFAAYQ